MSNSRKMPLPSGGNLKVGGILRSGQGEIPLWALHFKSPHSVPSQPCFFLAGKKFPSREKKPLSQKVIHTQTPCPAPFQTMLQVCGCYAFPPRVDEACLQGLDGPSSWVCLLMGSRSLEPRHGQGGLPFVRGR